MSWRSLQWLFSVLWLGTGGICLSLLLWVQQSEEESHYLLKAREFIRSRDRVLDALGDSSKHLGAAAGRLNAIETIARPYLMELSNHLKNSTAREFLQTTPRPLDSHATLVVFRGGEVLFRSEDRFEYHLGQSWSSKLASALSPSSDEELASMALNRLYGYPMALEDFLSTATSFQQLFFRNRTAHRWYDNPNGYHVLWLLNLDSLGNQELTRKVLESMAKDFGAQLTSGSDTVVLGSGQVRIGDGHDGVGLWIPSGLDSFSTRLLHAYPVISVWVCLWLLLLKNGGVRLLATRARLRLSLILILSLSVIATVFWKIRSDTLQRERLLQHQLLTERSVALGRSLAVGFQRYVKDLGCNILEAFQNGRLLDLNLQKKGFFFVTLQEEQRQILSSVSLGGPRPTWIEVAAKAVLGDVLARHFYEGQKSPSEVIELWQLNSVLTETHHIVTEVVRQKSHIYSSRDLEQFVFFPVMSGGFYGFWAMSGQKPNRKVMVIGISALSMMEGYFKEKAHQQFKEHQGLYIGSNHMQNKNRTLGAVPIPPGDGPYWIEGCRQNGGEMAVNDTTFIRMLPKEMFPGWTLLTIDSLIPLQKRLEELNRGFTKALIIALLLSTTVMVLTSLRIGKAVERLREGFRAFAEGDFQFRLKLSGLDEAAQAVSAYNHFVSEAETMQRMLPFVSRPMLELLAEGEEVLRREQEAVVLFSDIRSFTSISENRTPEEVVEMLNTYFEVWQRHAEKFGGVVERFIGDAIRIVYFEHRGANYMQDAVETAIAVRRELPELNREREKKGQFTIQNGVGLSKGKVRVLLAGDDHKLEFLAQGSPVLQSEELESQSRYASGTQIVMDTALACGIRHLYVLQPGPVENSFEIKDY